MTKSFLLIRFFEDDATEWGRFDGDGRLLDGPHSGLPSSGEAGDARVVVLAPGESVLLTSARVPTRNPAKLRRALPYALEDRLVGDVSAQHVAAGPVEPERGVAAAVVARARLDDWLERLAGQGLEPDALFPEPLALPSEDDGTAVLLENGRAVVRTGPCAGFACEADLLTALDVDASDLVRSGNAAVPPGLGEPRWLDGGVLPWLARGAASAPLDLLQGAYRPRRAVGGARRWWLAAAAAVLAWGVLELGLVTGDYLRLKALNDDLDARIEAVFRDSFPGQPVRDPAAQMRQQLGLLASDEAGALDLLRHVAPVMERAVNVRLEGLEYRDRRLLLNVRADNIGALDALRSALGAGGAFRVELASATATASGVDGRLAITGGGA